MAVALAAAAGNDDHVNGSGGDIPLGAPASIAAGDLRIHYTWQVAGTPPASVGTGMTDIGSDVLSTSGIRASWKIAGGSEGTITHTTAGADTASTGYSLRATGTHQTTPINTFAIGHTASGTSPRTLPTVTTTVDNCLIVYYVFATSGTVACTMSGLGAAYDTAVSNGSVDIVSIYSETKATAGTTTARTVSWTGGGSFNVAYTILALAPPDPAALANIKLGDLNVSACKLGDLDVSAVYLGDIQVFG